MTSSLIAWRRGYAVKTGKAAQNWSLPSSPLFRLPLVAASLTILVSSDHSFATRQNGAAESVRFSGAVARFRRPRGASGESQRDKILPGTGTEKRRRGGRYEPMTGAPTGAQTERSRVGAVPRGTEFRLRKSHNRKRPAGEAGRFWGYYREERYVSLYMWIRGR